MKERCYKSANEIIGPCGPCSFINLIGFKGGAKLEKELSELGRLKPFQASDFTSYLAWAEKYNADILIYVERLMLSDKIFEVIFKYEKIPKEKQNPMKKECLEKRSNLIKKYKSKIKRLKVHPIRKINELLNKGYRVAFNLAQIYKGQRLGHERVAYKREGKTYYIKDSDKGLIKISERQMKEELNNLKEIDYGAHIVAYKSK